MSKIGLSKLDCRKLNCKHWTVESGFQKMTCKILDSRKWIIIHNFAIIIIHNYNTQGCGGAGCPPPPPIIFHRFKLPQQIINRRKGNLSESPNQFKYRKNILISRLYDRFSRNGRNLGHFWKFEKFQTLKT